MSLSCTFCKSKFGARFNLNKHLRELHKVIPSSVKYNQSACNHKCLECNSSFKQNASLVKHLETAHGLEILREEIVFTSKEAFACWKKEREEEEVVNYIRTRGKRILNSGSEMHYFSCNRSARVGKLPKVDQRKRLPKSQGSCKINHACISQMTAIIKKSGKVHMSRIVTHYGHRNELQHVRINADDRKTIASKLIHGVHMKQILDEKRNNIGRKLKRIDLLTLEDINNIRKSIKLSRNEVEKHQNDSVSVEGWVKECEKQIDNPILLYKKQGEEAEDFNVDNFCLIVMDKFQQDMLKKYGSNIIALDSTQGQSGYDFELTTVLIVDEYSEGFPVAEMFTNRKGTHVHSTFLNALKSRVGVIQANTFLSDVTSDFYNAWVRTMGPVQNRLYCSWRVDYDWRKNLSKIHCKEKQNNVYKTLKVLQYNVDSTSFVKQLSEFTKSLFEDNDTKDFGIYFIKKYVCSTKQWAMCYQKVCDINVNMKLESMYKVIKSLFLNKRTIQRLDKGLHAVLQYIRHKTVDLLIRCTKEKYSIHEKQIIKRHKAAETKYFDLNLSENDNEWNITDDGKEYIVKQLTSKKCCKLSCVYCNICVHTYSCTCFDYITGCLICKHIHYVVRKEQPVDNIIEEFVDDNTIEIEFCMSPVEQQSNEKHKELVEKITNKITSLNTTLHSNNLEDIDEEHLSQILSYLNNVDALLNFSTSKNQAIIIEQIFGENNNLSSHYEQYDHDYVKQTSNL